MTGSTCASPPSGTCRWSGTGICRCFRTSATRNLRPARRGYDEPTRASTSSSTRPTRSSWEPAPASPRRLSRGAGLRSPQLAEEPGAQRDEAAVAPVPGPVKADTHVERYLPVHEHQRPVGEQDGLIDVVRDEQDGR